MISSSTTIYSGVFSCKKILQNFTLFYENYLTELYRKCKIVSNQGGQNNEDN